MKKIILLAITMLILTGCNIEEEVIEKETRYIQDYGVFNFYVDKKTCVEYIRYLESGLSVRYNADGTIKLNEECLNDKNNRSKL